MRRAGKNLIRRWAADPVRFSAEALGVKLWGKQAAIARSVVSQSRTAAKSGHKIGKSTGGAALAIWWPLTRHRGRTILTAPAGHQIRNILWPEVRRLYRQARFPIGGHCSPDPSRGLELPGDRGIICVTTDEAEKIAGLSGPNQLFIVDEASGYDERLWAPIFGNMAGGGRLLATGNPTQTSGTFFEAFTEKSHLWATFTVSSAESPNVVSGRELVPGLARKPWVLEMLEEHAGIRLDPDCSHEELCEALERATDSPFLDIRVKGRFPSQADNCVVPLSLIEAAKERWAETNGSGDLNIGIDVARSGDDESILCPRRGKRAYELEPHRNLDGPQLADRAIAMVARMRRGHERPRIKVDVIGVGASCYDSLAARAEALDLDVVPVNVSESSDDEDKYKNLRAQVHFATKSWLADGGAIPPDQKLHAELSAARYSFDERGRYVVEKKEKIKERLRRSPDRADALGLSIYEGTSDLGSVIAVRRSR